MWVMTPIGFYSAVQHRDDHSKLMVRSRSRADLEALIDFAGGCLSPSQLTGLGTIETTLRDADYPHRIVIAKRTWKALLAYLTDDIDYDNFKTAVGRINPGRAHLYHDVWSTMLKAEREPGAGVYAPEPKPKPMPRRPPAEPGRPTSGACYVPMKLNHPEAPTVPVRIAAPLRCDHVHTACELCVNVWASDHEVFFDRTIGGRRLLARAAVHLG